MPVPQPPERFGALDAVFLNFECKEMPLHIGGICIFDGPIPFKRFVATIESKLDQLPRYRQKVVRPFLNVGFPTWQYDPNFDISRHIFEVKLDKPGTDEQLRQLANRLFTPLMDREKPLWEVYVVEGLAGRRSAIIAKVHHCLVDGVAGIGLMNVMLDPSAHTPKPGKRKPFHPPPAPDPAKLFLEGLKDSVRQLPKRLSDAQKGLASYGALLVGDDIARLGVGKLVDMLPELLSPLEKLPFNRPCSGERRVFWSEFPFQEARAIKSAAGTSVNDVVLTVVSGAVSRYVKLNRQTVKNRYFRAMVPVDLRPQITAGAVGNMISALPVTLPLGILDPLKRLRHIHSQMQAMKASRMADLVRMGVAWLGLLPPAVQTVLAGNLEWLNTPIPIFHMVCTNVPGPQFPLYTCGRRMLHCYPHVPTGMDVGISVAISSYDGKLAFALTTDAKAAPDAARMKEFVEASFAELREAAGVPATEPSEPKPRAPRKAKRVISSSRRPSPEPREPASAS